MTFSNSITKPVPELRSFDEQANPDRRGKLVGDFSTTTRCNARCIGCYTNAATLSRSERSKLGREFLDARQWHDLLEQLVPHIRTLVISGLGDLTFDRWQMNQTLIDQALAHGIHVCIFTNGIVVDDTVADWIAERRNLSVIGKWLHTEPAQHTRLLGLRHGDAGSFVECDGYQIPHHLQMFMDRGLQHDNRLAVACTMLQSNRLVAPPMWRWLREHNLIPNFSWLVPTPGMGRQAKDELGEDLDLVEREQLTRECWQVDQQIGYQWAFCMGPRIGVSRCGDEWLVYFGPFGDVRLCPSSHETPLGFWPDFHVDQLVAHKLGLEKSIVRQRDNVEGCPGCICSARCGTSDSQPVVTIGSLRKQD